MTTQSGGQEKVTPPLHQIQTKKQAIVKISSLLSSIGLPVTPELVRQASLDGSNVRIHELLVLSIHALLIIHANGLWLLPSLKEKIQKLVNSDQISMLDRLRYIRCSLQTLGFTLHFVTAQSTSRQKLLTFSWLLLRVEFVPWYAKRMESLHKDFYRLPNYPSDMNRDWLEETEAGEGEDGSQVDLTTQSEIDMSDLSLDEMSRVLVALARKIHLKSRFFESHFKTLARLIDETQKKTEIADEPLHHKLTPYELMLACVKKNEDELHNHVNTLRFLADTYEAFSTYFNWIETIATSEKLQGSGVVRTLDLDLTTLNRQLKQFNLDYFAGLVQSVKEIHETILLDSLEDDKSQTRIEDERQDSKQWWTQVGMYERKIREIETTKLYREHQSGEDAIEEHIPFVLNPCYERLSISIEQHSKLPSGVALEIKRLEAVLNQVSERLDQLREKHKDHLSNIMKVSQYTPI